METTPTPDEETAARLQRGLENYLAAGRRAYSPTCGHGTPMDTDRDEGDQANREADLEPRIR